MPGSRRRLRFNLFAMAAALAIGGALAGHMTPLLRGLELNTLDARFAVRGTQEPPRDVVLVTVDDVTFAQLRERWPFPRSLHGRLLDRLRRAGARAVAFDIQFTEPSADPKQDEALIAAVGRAPHTVLATTETTKDGGSAVFGGDKVLRQIGARSGNALLPSDPGGVLRRLPYDIRGLESFAVVTAEAATGRRIRPADLGGGDAYVDYAGPPGTFETVPYSRALLGQVPASTFRGKVVVVGPSAPSLQDLHPTSTTGSRLMSGAEIQGNAIDTAMRGFPLRRGPAWLTFALIALLGAAGPAALMRLRPPIAVAALFAAGAGFVVAAQVAFDSGTVIKVAAPLIALGIGVAAGAAVLLVTGAFERQRVRDIFARFVPEAVVDQVLAEADGELRLGGTARDATVMFSDVRDFTTLSESRPPDLVIDILNRYLTAMTEVILGHGGTLVAYMGDGIMAVFGAPVDQPDHADRALAAAREMTGPALARFNDWLRETHGEPALHMGVGLNAGTVMSGNVGSEQRMEYTCIGDTTNTAARLESLTKGSGWSIYVADSVRTRLLHDDAADLVPIPEMEIRGRSGRLVVWATGETDGGAGPGGGAPAIDHLAAPH